MDFVRMFLDVLGMWDVWWIIVFLALLCAMTQKVGPFLKDCQFSESGIQFVILGGRIRGSQIRKEDIRDVTIMSGFVARIRNPLALNYTNRITRRILFVRTNGRRSYMLSPANPEEAIRAMGLSASD